MGYFDTVREAKAGREAMIDNQVKKKTFDNFRVIKPKIDKAIIDATKEGVKTGAAAMYEDINRSMGMQNRGGAMGMSADTASVMGDNALTQKAMQIIDEFDSAQAEGVPAASIAKAFNALDPNLKSKVQALKLEKEQLKQEELNAINQVAGMQENQMEQQRSNTGSPITESAKQILMETANIGRK